MLLDSGNCKTSLLYFSKRWHQLLPSSTRFHSSQTNHEEEENNEFKPKPKPKSQSSSKSKTKRSKSMANLINTTTTPWSKALEASLDSLSPSPLSKTTLLQTLRLIKTPKKALNFFDWVSNQKGFTHDSQSFFLMLEILGRARNLNAARNFLFSIEKRSKGEVKLEDKFFNCLIRSYANAGLFEESVKLFENMKMMSVSPSVITFNSLMMVLMKRGRTNMAGKVFDEMLGTYGVTPDSYTFNVLIRGYCKNSMVDEGFRVFKEMERYRCDPDVVTYNTIVDGLCRAGKVGIARNVVKGMYNKGVDLHPNVVTYTTLVRGYCMRREIDEALAVFSEMMNRGLKANEITYNTLTKGLCEAGRFDKMREILDGGEKVSGFVPDTCTFNTLINAHCDAGNLDEAMKVFREMSNLRVRPDSATYSVLIRNLCQRRDFDGAEELFDELSRKEIPLSDDGCKPLVAAYNPMFEYLCASGKTKKAEVVFRQLMKRGVQDPPSYKILIMGNCKEGKFKAGYELLVLMLRMEYVLDFETYQSLINGLLQKGEAILAYETLIKMLRSSYMPGMSTYHSVLEELVKKRYANECFDLLMLMVEKKIALKINLSTLSVRLLFGNGLKDKAFQIVHSIYAEGYVVKMEELIEFLYKSKMLFDAYKLLLVCLEKHKSLDIDFCSKVIEGLCKSKRLSEAFRLYYELVERGDHQRLSCCEYLRNALEAAGKTNEVQFMSKRIQTVGKSDKYPKLNPSLC